MTSGRALGLLLAFGFALAPPAWAQDSDGDGIPDPLDVFPCDPSASAVAFHPGDGQHGTILMEDQWPSRGDLDFNDLVVSHHVTARLTASGAVSALRLQLEVLAVGGIFDNGLALRLPVHRSAVASVERRVGQGAPQPLAPSAMDDELTFVLQDNVRDLFGGQRGPINRTSSDERRRGDLVVVDVVFAAPVSLPLGSAPWDLFLFRTADPGHEVHRPEYAGSARMRVELFGTDDDGSTPARRFVDGDGLPFVVLVPADAPHPQEATPIHVLYPQLIDFARSGGATHLGWYGGPVASHAYRDLLGNGRPAPLPVAALQVDRTCHSCSDGLHNGREEGIDCGGPDCPSCAGEVVFAYTGGAQSFVVPPGVTELEVKMWGGGGQPVALGGAGGYTFGRVQVTPGEVLGVEVGGPDIAPLPLAYQTYGRAGSRSALWRGAALGELLVAGGGGAGGGSAGGAGGGLAGQNSLGGPSTACCYNQTSYPAGGGSQTAGGAAGTATSWSGHNSTGVAGGRNRGSQGHNNNLHQGGYGGGGYFGGGSGGATAYSGAGGGGGSGFVAGSVSGGLTLAGNRGTPGNASDPDRDGAGAPAAPGRVIIRW